MNAPNDEDRIRDSLIPALIELVPAPMVIYQGEKIRLVNQALCDLTGYTHGELEEMSAWEIVHPDDREMSRQNSLARQAGEIVPNRYELRLLTKDGEARWIDSTTCIFQYEGEPASFTTALDITERKEAEQALDESEQRFHALFRSAADYLFVVDVLAAEGPTIVDCNEAACQAHGYTRDEMIGMPLRQLDTPESTKATKERIALLKEKKVISFEAEHRRKDGSTFPLEVSAVLVPVRGKPVVFAIERDISERKAFEAQLLRAEKLESLGLLAGGIAHDFNNILTAVMGGISISRELVGPHSEAQEHLEAAQKATATASRLTGQLLTFAKGGTPVKKAMRLAELIRESTEFASHGANVQLLLSVAPDLQPIEGDPTQISQVLHNLVINAVQAMPNGGMVEVSAKNDTLDDAPAVCIEVRDHGEGILPEHLPKIFDPYFTTKRDGTGLGLASTHSIVRRHGGRIDVDSTPQQGARFRVRLPALRRVVAEETCAEQPQLPSCGRVLVMDDAAPVREATIAMLGQLRCRAVGAAEGEEAIELFHAARELGDPFELVILDLTVAGGLGGVETLEALKQIDPGVIALVASGYSDAPVMARYKEHGFAGMLRKPFSVDDLRRALCEISPPRDPDAA